MVKTLNLLHSIIDWYNFLLQGGFKVSLLAKDMTLAENLADRSNAQTDLAKLATAMYKHLIDKGCQDKDFSYIYEYLKNKG